jgi:hypothetical protein
LVGHISLLIERIEPDQLAIVVFCRIGLLNNDAITSPSYTCSQDAILPFEEEAFYNDELGVRTHLNFYPVDARSCRTLLFEEVVQPPKDICRASETTGQNHIFLEDLLSVQSQKCRGLGEGTYY